MEAAPPLRHDALKAKLARLGEHGRALGGERFAEQDSVDAADEPQERAAPLFDGMQAQIVPTETQGRRRSARP
jgi:hypothetical protein